MIPKNITAQHILQALADVDHHSVPVQCQSTVYDLVHNDKRYPPKYVISLANRLANGEELDPGLFISTESRSFLVELGFVVRRRSAR